MGFGAPFLTDPAGVGVAPRLDQRPGGQLRPQSVRLCLCSADTAPLLAHWHHEGVAGLGDQPGEE